MIAVLTCAFAAGTSFITAITEATRLATGTCIYSRRIHIAALVFFTCAGIFCSGAALVLSGVLP